MKDALVIGNGPSVKHINNDILMKYDSFGCNHIYKMFPMWKAETDNLVITDSNRINETGRSLVRYSGELWVGNENYILPPIKKIESILGRDFKPLKQLPRRKLRKWKLIFKIPVFKYLHLNVFDKVNFTFNHNQGLNFGYSVVISAIQIAVIKGYKVIKLIGVDSSYNHPKEYFSEMKGSVQYVNNTFVENPRLYMEPLLVNLQISLENHGVRIIDCTPGGKLRFIEKGSL